MTATQHLQSTSRPIGTHDLEASRALVLGATGSFGSAITQRLLQQGWHVTALKRDLTGLPSDARIDWRQGDALNQKDVVNACQGCQIIVHAVNPAGYRNWETLVIPMLENTLQAARHHQACVFVPGNMYNFDAHAGTHIEEDTPQQPSSKKGQIRVLMEQKLQAFAQQGGRCVVVRCGDFFGPSSNSGWFEKGIAPKGATSKRLFNLAEPGIGHQWAYIPDVAEVMMQLILRRHELPDFARFHMAGHWDHDGKQMINTAAQVIAQQRGSRPCIKTFPWWLICAASVFNPTYKELLEMRYLWQHPLHLSNEKLIALLGTEPHTPLKEAITATLINRADKD